MERFETYKEIYDREIARRAELNNDLSIPIGVISVLITGLYYILTSFDFKLNYVLSCIFILGLSVSGAFLGFAIYHLLRSYIIAKSSNYCYLAYPNEIEDYYQKSLDHYRSEQDTDVEKKANDDLCNYFIAAYIRTSNHNAGINDDRATYLYNSKLYLARTLSLLLIAGIPYLINNFIKEEKTYKIEVPKNIRFNASFFTDSINKLPNSMNEDPKKTTDQSTTEKPEPPKDRYIKEGHIPEKPKPLINESDKNQR